MFNPIQYLQQQFGQKYTYLRDAYEGFRIYDFGSTAINRFTPSKGYRVQHNIAYGLKARQRLDLYLSEQGQNRPLIVFVHGGAWCHGDKRDYRFVGEAFARFGYDVAVINYHLAPQHKFPRYVDDLALALEFLDQQQQKLAVSTTKIALMGHSAGAFNVTSLLYNPQNFGSHVRQKIKTVIGIAGPYHFDYKGAPLAEPAFDQQVPYQQVMPYYFVEKNDIQHYLFLAENDQLVKPKNSYDFQQKLLEQGNHCVVRIIPKTGHVSIMGSVSSIFSRFFQTRSAVIKALDSAMKND